MNARAKMLEKVRALLAKTVANGCTEAEAMAALGKARELMNAHEIGPEDLREAQDDGAEICNAEPGDTHEIKAKIAVAVAAFCDCKAWRHHGQIQFCGLRPDAEFAAWLVDHLAAFVRRELVDYLARTRYARTDRPRLIRGFALGCCSRISQRLHALARPPASSNGRALVTLKNALIAARIAADGINLSEGAGGSRNHESEAAHHGRRAGDRAQFGRPVDGPTAQARLFS